MGTDTGLTANTFYMTGRGSDYFGVCEVCKKHMSEATVFQRHKIGRHADGFLYLSASSSGLFAHRECSPHDMIGIIDKATLPRRGKLVVYPKELLNAANPQWSKP